MPSSSPSDRNSPLGGNSTGSELSPLGGGQWREIKPANLKRRHVSHREGSSAETETTADVDADVLSQPVVSEPAATGAPSPPKVIRLERRQELEHRIKGNPTDLDAFMELGRIYRAEDRPADARRVFQQAIQVFPEERQLQWEHEEAVLARSLQQLREVVDVAKRLDTIESERELKRCQDDWACRRMDVCRARLARDPSLSHLRVVLAEAMYDAGLYEGGIEELRGVLDDPELSSAAHLIQSRCLLEMGKDIEAMASLRATALRRSVTAPVRTRVAALRLLCETAERLGLTLTLAQYRHHLQKAEHELAETASRTGRAASQAASPSSQNEEQIKP